SDNLMIKGIAEMFREKGNHIITQAIEHKAVLDTCKNLEKHGFEVTYLPVQHDGRISLDDLKAAIRPKTILITIMYANNEIGVINPIAEIGKIAKEHGILFAVDGVQAVGKIPVVVQKDSIHRLPNNRNMSFAYVEGESLLMGINDVAVSSGSACTSATLEPSYVLKALGVGEDLAHTSIRFGLGRFNTQEEVDYVIDKMVQVV